MNCYLHLENCVLAISGTARENKRIFDGEIIKSDPLKDFNDSPLKNWNKIKNWLNMLLKRRVSIPEYSEEKDGLLFRKF